MTTETRRQIEQARQLRAQITARLDALTDALQPEDDAPAQARRPIARRSRIRPHHEPDRDSSTGYAAIGIIARAQIEIPYGLGAIIETIDSPGLWGVEYDVAPDYAAQVYAEELEILADMLAALNVEIIDDQEASS